MNASQKPTTSDLYQLAGYPEPLEVESITLLRNYPLLDNLENTVNQGYSCIFNWSSMQYLFMSDSVKHILGYTSKSFLEKGLNFTLSIIHPEDMLKFKELHQTIFNYFYSIPAAQRPKIRFSYNLRVKTADNNYVHILRQSTFIRFSVDGKPTIESVHSTDITGFKHSNHINLTIHQLSDAGTYLLCHEQEFSEAQTKLTEREKQVLELVRLGYTTKEIAYHLYLAIETVKSHRKHIIAKTGACNMTAAVNMVNNKGQSQK
ncbi:LuxR C-terminal-related transcriptional regulator [Pedobacter gandavensis]|uniref:LuxR C-terminal-related transcriptional regulator n=1 Tax=Pedobacter gandavensis TaxID=2679963 RepID=UPI00292D0DA2|nr:LuxR C-terminal-related transcriptional regulator [Pedobacter gandavensis]